MKSSLIPICFNSMIVRGYFIFVRYFYVYNTVKPLFKQCFEILKTYAYIAKIAYIRFRTRYPVVYMEKMIIVLYHFLFFFSNKSAFLKIWGHPAQSPLTQHFLSFRWVKSQNEADQNIYSSNCFIQPASSFSSFSYIKKIKN